MDMKNSTTGELCAAHRLGTDDEGRDVYQFVEGWELVTHGAPVWCDEDGNYVFGDGETR